MLARVARQAGVPKAALPMAIRYVFRFAKMKDIPGLDREDAHRVFKDFLTASKYMLVDLRRAVVCSCRGGNPLLWAIRFRVAYADVKLALRTLTAGQRASLAALPYWPRDAKVVARVLEILAPQCRNRVRAKLTFIERCDPSTSLDDMYWRVIGEAARLTCVYDRLVPTRKVDEVKTARNVVKLSAQPVNRVNRVSVNFDGRSITVPRSRWAIHNDVVTIDPEWWAARVYPKERLVVSVDYDHSLEMLNFVGKGVRHEVGRLISYYTAKRRHRSVRTQVASEGKEARYDHTTTSMSSPATAGADGKARTMAEVIADPSDTYGGVENTLAADSILRKVSGIGDQRLVTFTKICLGEAPASFVAWCRKKNLKIETADVSTSADFKRLRKAALEYTGLREEDLLLLKSVVIDAA